MNNGSPARRSVHVPACVANRRMIDRADDPHNVGFVQVYDTAARTWGVLESLMPVAGGKVFAVGCKILVLGGCTDHKEQDCEDPLYRIDGPEMGPPNAGGVCLWLLTGEEAAAAVMGGERSEEEGENEDDEDDEDDDEDNQPMAWGFAFPYNSPKTAESWCLDTETGEWSQLSPAPKEHLGWYLYLDGGVIRAADDPELNYIIADDEWVVSDLDRAALLDHRNASEVVVQSVPF